MNNIIKIAMVVITTIIIYSNNKCVEIENIPQTNNPESQKKYSWEAFEEERKKVNSIIDMTDLQQEYDETLEKLKQIKYKTEIIQATKEDILRLKIKKRFLKESLKHAQQKSEDYRHNLSAMMHGLDEKALHYNCYDLKKYNYEQCSHIRDQEYYNVKTMILTSSQKNNISVEPMSKSLAQERYDAAKMKINNLYKKRDEEYLNSLSPEEAERQKKLFFTLDGYICKHGDYRNHETHFYDHRFMIEYKKESPYENDILATMHGLNQALSKKYQTPEFSDRKYNTWNLYDRHSIIELKTNAIINMQHISNLRLIKEWEIAQIHHDKTKKEINLSIENLMKTNEGKQYKNALEEYMIQKSNVIKELKSEGTRSCSWVNNSNRETCQSIEETHFALIAKTLSREPLALKGIDYDIQNKFNSAQENYYQATELLIATEQYHNNFAPTEQAYYYWKYKEKGLDSIIKENSCAIRTKYLPSPGHTARTSHYFEHPIKTIERMKRILIKKLYPPRKDDSSYLDTKTPDDYAYPPLCYKIRERVVTELLSIIEEMRIDAGLDGEDEGNFYYKIGVDKKSTFEHDKELFNSD
jgi:hypothetical protein